VFFLPSPPYTGAVSNYFASRKRETLDFKTNHPFKKSPAAFALVLALLTLNCATSSGLKTLSDQAVLLEVPVVSQTAPNLCGEVALEMLTRYYNLLLTPEQEAALKKQANQEKGITGAALKTVLEQQGYFVAVFPGTLDHKVSGLYHHLDLKRPLIVMIQGDSPDKNHYVLAVGYDEDTNSIVLLDPVRGELAMSLINFKKVWGKVDNFTLLAVPKKLKNQ
jgi:ABC-type bacteriocin/lantibiotic exporter with double-glycine peptidase domain